MGGVEQIALNGLSALTIALVTDVVRIFLAPATMAGWEKTAL